MSEPALQPDPDHALMRRVARGDRAAFAELVARHHVSLFRLFRRLGLDAHAAEDCVQDTCLRLLRAAPSYRPAAPFRAFLRRLARNALVDWTRRRKDGAVLLRDPRDPALLERAAHAPESPLDVRAAVERLSLKLRDVVRLSVYEGLSHAEVAQRLDIPEGTVKSRLHHALRHLREALGP
ncbi:MAG TPA: sigma-70 family RNA polymerase sigma factor [Planctomycetota bacterium]|nr:sigma-70 family RNA polymerase sigma factor [Planctomycetota bacterium]